MTASAYDFRLRPQASPVTSATARNPPLQMFWINNVNDKEACHMHPAHSEP